MVSEYKNPRSKYYTYIGVAIFSFLVLLPIYILAIIAFGDPSQTVAAYYPALIPSKFTLVNFIRAFSGYGSVLIAAFYKSLETAFIVASLAILLGYHAAYGLSKLSFKISSILIALLFFSTMIPSLTIAIPISVSFLKLGLYDSAFGLALAQELIVLPLTIFLMMGALQSVPKQLESQARVDGAGFFQTLYQVIFPLAIPGVISAFLLSWMMSWDEFTFAVILSPVHPTLPILIYFDSTARGDILTATSFSLLVTLPVIVLTIVLSKFIKGSYLTAGITG
ncbi:MAG: carbohydrate ABC transporter permease [Thermoplasmatales archaeon]|nr:carbohydrate ABC transporter permease [Thermoplasmatales archaeon]MCW6169817.1 carbohydrate ABC transporter permease [Thermoplasmatales archaeon]